MLSTKRQFSSISQSNSAPCKHDAEVKVVFSETVNLSMNNVSKASLPSCRHLPAMMSLEKGHQGFCYYSLVAVSTWLAEKRHINISINLLTKSICEPTINKFMPIRNKLTQFCQWADKEQHNLKPMKEPTVKNEQNMIFLNQHNIIKKKLECNGHRATMTMEQMR